MPQPLISSRARPLTGTLRIPGDKSISHRSLILGGLAVGETTIEGLLEGEDVLATAAAMRAFGATVEHLGPGSWRVVGRGVGGLDEPADVIDCGNAGTGMRLLMGTAAGQPITTFFTGDGSLRRRPMGRVGAPLAQMGVKIVSRDGGRPPLAVTGPETLTPITYTLPVASAQVKSAILLAGLAAPGETTVIEPKWTRDHTETMLRHFGAEVRVEDTAEGRRITVVGEPELTGRPVIVPADPSSAAFPAVAALLVEGSELLLPGVGTNPLRFGLFETLLEMGADIELTNKRIEAGEPVADLVVRHSLLKGIDVPAERAPSMIDEYPILAVAAAHAEGTTIMRGLDELRVKESDRLAATATGLTACGARVEVDGDDLTVHGASNGVAGGATIAVDLDHRIAMAFLVLGMVSGEAVAIDDEAAIATSFPGFKDLMNGAGAAIGTGA
ncbi:3-phosphoshikimate 1-carboxyvinyltransferase [Thalassobaculum sp. OXR-137]|uniref:3-phosphoshikimate 1-carboxyvinyltransferase n=1 Tax=Thalassobaculum sp. OXR-137 TaxID=3100173 RepID=UPI002AC8AD2E|nr:3-phosphoshikimate 1-carboxyvinyltransferase [Thalassobaculum sp. OXR-137]WPZ37062.1 3-phosphoshikimate 1-carboxyvinyltransferase [Thalassobaculum sp. OXR-137]